MQRYTFFNNRKVFIVNLLKEIIYSIATTIAVNLVENSVKRKRRENVIPQYKHCSSPIMIGRIKGKRSYQQAVKTGYEPKKGDGRI